MKIRILTLLAALILAVTPVCSHASARYATATFAGGCFWCMEQAFEKLPGVVSVVSGYTGGVVENPTYGQVSAGGTGHVEAVQITYDPGKTGFEKLLEAFWRQIDPTDRGGQFADRGSQYRSVIFYHDPSQKRAAEASKLALERAGVLSGKVVTEILPAGKFFRAEEYHQDYYRKNPAGYRQYHGLSGRDRFLEKTWGQGGRFPSDRYDPGSFRKPSRQELAGRLTPLQFRVTQGGGTEPPFRNDYWDNKREGIYVDIVSGEPLFSSRDKYDSGTGWPSFTRPLNPAGIVLKKDKGLFIERTEVRSSLADSHLGHVFDDGPPPAGKRYCINSAALRFIPKAEMEKKGYGEYLKSLHE